MYTPAIRDGRGQMEAVMDEGFIPENDPLRGESAQELLGWLEDEQYALYWKIFWGEEAQARSGGTVGNLDYSPKLLLLSENKRRLLAVS